MSALNPTDDADKLKARRTLAVDVPAGVNPLTEHSTINIHPSLYTEWREEREKSGRWNVRDRVNDAVREQRRKAAAKRKSGSAPSVPRATKRPTYEWTEKLVCDHAGRPDARPLAPLDPNRKRRRVKPSIKVGCPAFFWARKRIGEDVVVVEVHHRHEGHQPGTVDDMQESRMSLQAREWLRGLAQKGTTWPTFKALLRHDPEELTNGRRAKLGLATDLAETWRISYQDAYNHMRRALLSATRLARDPRESALLWLARLRSDGWTAELCDVVTATGERTWALCMISKWQEGLLQRYGRLVCMDSTHNTAFALENNEKAFLYSLVIKHQTTGKGCPAAFMITPSETQHPITTWLRWLRDHFSFFLPRHFMIDCSVTEAASIRESFNDVVEEQRPRILWCDYHLFKAVRAKAVSLLGHNKAGAAFNDFKLLVDAASPPEFDSAWSAFQVKYRSSAAWVTYMRTQNVSVRERWGRAWRDDVLFDVHTNNLIEAWHRQLKQQYLKMMRQQRVDFLICVLAENVIADYESMELKIDLGFAPRQLDFAETKRRNEAYAIPSDLAPEMVYEDKDGKLLVESQQDSSRLYTITHSDNLLIDCSCPDASKRRVICKHMWLAQRVTNFHIAPPNPEPLSPPPAGASSSSSAAPASSPPGEPNASASTSAATTTSDIDPQPYRLRSYTAQPDLPPAISTAEPTLLAANLAAIDARMGEVSSLAQAAGRRPQACSMARGRAVEDALSYLQSAVMVLKNADKPLYARQRA